MDFFNSRDFDLLSNWAGKKYNNTLNDHKTAYEEISKIYLKVDYWMRHLAELLGSDFRPSILKKPTNQQNKFEHYLWGKIYPASQFKGRVAITTVITSEHKIELKIDLIGDGVNERKFFERAKAQAGVISWSWNLQEFDGSWDSFFKKADAAALKLGGLIPEFNKRVNRIGIVASVVWNSSKWQGDPTAEDLNHGKGFENVEKYKIAGEALNFAHGKYQLDKEGYYYGYSPHLNRLPAIRELEIIVLISRDFEGKNVIVGYYKKPVIGEFDRSKLDLDEEVYERYTASNFKSKREDIFVLDKPILFSEEDFLPEGMEKAKQRFNYIDGYCIDKILTAIHGDLAAGIEPPTFHLKESYMAKYISKNTVLYGPPGTGKTYSTISKSVMIANPAFSEASTREQFRYEYERLVDAGQIVFTTFHQSMSYEEFIEGLKPEEPKREGLPVTYKVLPGLFKRICEEASFPLKEMNADEVSDEELEFSELYDGFLENLRQRISKGEKIELESRKTGGSVLVDKISDQDNIIIKHHDGVRTYTVSKFRLTKLNSAFPELEQVSNIHLQFKEVMGGSNSSAYWSVLNAIRKGKVEKVKSIKNEKKYELKNYVMIIDEINRGNVSQIFGELITLLEEDKRIGAKEAMSLKLSYSKESFGVPSNLYIIGTMNTADRSVEALDTALRRRFTFQEMIPEHQLLKKSDLNSMYQLDLSEILRVINLRIEKLINKDHLIGHSYFLDLKDISDLKIVFANKIIPLLQEYFYGDLGKVGLVLGKDFLELKSSANDVDFADFDDYESGNLSTRSVYVFKDINVMNDKVFLSAVRSIASSKK
jgi:hypothetical protein